MRSTKNVTVRNVRQLQEKQLLQNQQQQHDQIFQKKRQEYLRKSFPVYFNERKKEKLESQQKEKKRVSSQQIDEQQMLNEFEHDQCIYENEPFQEEGNSEILCQNSHKSKLTESSLDNEIITDHQVIKFSPFSSQQSQKKIKDDQNDDYSLFEKPQRQFTLPSKIKNARDQPPNFQKQNEFNNDQLKYPVQQRQRLEIPQQVSNPQSSKPVIESKAKYPIVKITPELPQKQPRPQLNQFTALGQQQQMQQQQERFHVKTPAKLMMTPGKQEIFGGVMTPFQQRNDQFIEVAKKYGFYKTEILGSGSFSKVYKGFKLTDKSLLVAIKEIQIRPDEEERYMQEIQVLLNIDSPYIVKLLDYEVKKKSQACYLVMEYCEQGNLCTNNDSLTRAEAIHFFKQILRAMEILNYKNIIHRDLKLENILLKNNQIKLADFGFAKLMNNQMQVLSQVCGTPATMAPELILNQDPKAYYTQKQDVWSLGVILHQLFYKSHPFDSKKDRMQLRLRINVSCPDKIVESFLEKALRHNQYQRMSLQECFEHEISQYIYDEKKFARDLGNQSTKSLNYPNNNQQTEKSDNNRVQDLQYFIFLGIILFLTLIMLYLR